MSGERVRILLFDPKVGGHHGSYLGILLNHLPDGVDLQLVVSPGFLVQHADLVEEAESKSATVVTLSSRELAALNASQRLRAPFSTAARPVVEWVLITGYARRLRSTHAVAMYFDPLLQLSMPLRFPAPCPVSGIYFRPTFHYQDFPEQPPMSRRERVRAARQRVALARSLAHPNMGVLFSLDRLAVPALEKLGQRGRVAALPDPVHAATSTPEQLQQLRTRLGLPSERRVALIFGTLTRRKGVTETLAAMELLPAHLARRLTLLIVGRMAPDLEAEVGRRISEMRAQDPHSVLVQDAFVSDDDVQRYFDISDLIVAPYQDHVGSSGIQVRAAMAGKPLLGPRYGLMGELSRRYALGPTVNSRAVPEIAACLSTFMDGGDLGVDATRQLAFGQEGRAENFARIFYAELASLESARNT